MFELIRPGTKIDFVGKRKLWIGISILCMLGTFVLLGTKGLNYGIDFTGGAEVQLRVPPNWDIGKVREEMEKGDIKGLKVQQIGLPSASRNGRASPISSVLGRLITSGTGSSPIHSSSFSNSRRRTPRSPSNIEIVSSPSIRGSVESDRLANASITHGASHSRSRKRGVFRKIGRYCWR